MEVSRKLLELGKLSKEQKEQMWKVSISGSQAWMLINEPYNLLRDKLNIERIHKSKYDVFNTPRFKQIGENAMACGTLYEQTVFQEVLQHTPDAVSEDICYELELYTDNNYVDFRITCTPDWIVWDKQKENVLLLGDIKCSTSAASSVDMSERYYPQLLHNCYIMNCFHAQLTTKNEITKPLNIFSLDFSQQDFDNYEKLLLDFIYAYHTKNETFYDYLAEQKEIQEKDNELKQIKEEDTSRLDLINNYIAIKNQVKQLSETEKELETQLKDLYSNCKVDANDNTLTFKTSKRKGAIDYTKYLSFIEDKYNLNLDEATKDIFRKADYNVVSITIKPNKGDNNE